MFGSAAGSLAPNVSPTEEESKPSPLLERHPVASASTNNCTANSDSPAERSTASLTRYSSQTLCSLPSLFDQPLSEEMRISQAVVFSASVESLSHGAYPKQTVKTNDDVNNERSARRPPEGALIEHEKDLTTTAVSEQTCAQLSAAVSACSINEHECFPLPDDSSCCCQRRTPSTSCDESAETWRTRTTMMRRVTKRVTFVDTGALPGNVDNVSNDEDVSLSSDDDDGGEYGSLYVRHCMLSE